MTAPIAVLVVGGGAREHALAWAVQRSPSCAALFVAPGNEATPGERVPIPADDVAGITRFATERSIDLVIVGPEVALAAGLVDALTAAGIPAFGPTRAAARLEWDKSYTRRVAAEVGLPSPTYAAFESATEIDAAITWWRARGGPVVIKQVGLAAGKGVAVPVDDESCVAAIRSFLSEGGVVLEERLHGPECSLLAFCDGITARPLPLAQDHKRVGEGDTGPNTGGMGAYAPAPVSYDAAALTVEFIQPVLDYMARHGTPFAGVLYAGLMLTADGPKLLEFNCRFGDPEAQVLLPLLETDLVELALACTQGRLAEVPVRIAERAALGVVVAAPDYPAPGPGLGDLRPLPWSRASEASGGSSAPPQQLLFRGSSGGRELTAVGIAATLATARERAYELATAVAPGGSKLRGDIGWRAAGASLRSYAAAGVDIDEGTRAVEQLTASVERTRTAAVLGSVGGFGGLFDLGAITGMRQPVLVASTDGVGTKVELAARAGRLDVPGQDIVNHCINDVLVQGARPLFFLDYFASASIRAEQVAAVVEGMSRACAAAGCALLGGETAEMPGVYLPGAFDVAGTLIGVVERERLLPRPDIGVGDVLVGLGSSGPHTNGYSLLRTLFEWLPLDARPAPLDATLADALLAPHRSYLDALTPALAHDGLVKGLAHITGGGLIDNLPRVLPAGCDAAIELGSWPVPPLFRLVEELATGLARDELYRTLNMGIGMVAVVAADRAHELRASIDEPSWLIGQLEPGERRVVLR